MTSGECGNDSLDFVVCGMPRGGTTFYGQLFNVHPDVFCYFMETGLLRQLALFASDRPFPHENLPALEQWLRSDMREVLLEGTREPRLQQFRRLVKYREVLAGHGLDEPSGPGLRVWDDATFDAFLRELLSLFTSGLYGAPLYEAALALLARHFRAVTQRSVLGEKTPDNLFHLDALRAASPALQVFCILREPYSTIESMKRRALRNAGFGDTAFAREVLGGLAEYYRYMMAAHEHALKAPAGTFHAQRFEDLVRDPETAMTTAWAALGLETPDVACRILPELSLPTDKRHIHDLGLSPAEHRLIEITVGPMLAHFGYEVGETPAGVTAAGGVDEGILPLAGVHHAGGPGLHVVDAWLARRADLFLLFREDRRKLVLNMGCNFPAALGVDLVRLDFEIGGQPIESMTVAPVHPWFEVELNLQGIAAASAGDGILGARLRISSSAAYAPITVAGMGHDMRDTSFLLRSCRFE